MTDEIKKSFKELQEAGDEIDKLSLWNDAYSSDKGVPYLDSDALAVAFERQRLARIKYSPLFYTEKGWPQERIEAWLNKVKWNNNE